jgi:hypothetical protein
VSRCCTRTGGEVLSHAAELWGNPGCLNRFSLSINDAREVGLAAQVRRRRESSNPGQLELARRFAEAQFDLARIRQARHELLSSGLDDHKSVRAHEDQLAVASSEKKSGAEKFVVNLSNQMRTLKRLVVARYHAAIPRREFNTALVEAV